MARGDLRASEGRARERRGVTEVAAKLPAAIARSLLTGLLLLAVAACARPGPAAQSVGVAAAGEAPAVGRSVRTASGQYYNLRMDELKAALERKDFVLVDVHVPNEGHLRPTDLRIPYDQIDQDLSRLPAAKDGKIVLYCMSGRMSQIAAERLVALGYTNVWNLERGMVGWREAGYELLPG